MAAPTTRTLILASVRTGALTAVLALLLVVAPAMTVHAQPVVTSGPALAAPETTAPGAAAPGPQDGTQESAQPSTQDGTQDGTTIPAGSPAPSPDGAATSSNTPQPTGQPLPSKRQRVADSLVAAFLLVVLVGGVTLAWFRTRRPRTRRSA